MLIILFSNNIFGQNDSIFNDTIHNIETKVVVNDSTFQKKDSILSFKDLIKPNFNDSTNLDSINSKKEPSNISPDAITDVIDYSSADSILFSMSDKKMYLYGVGELASEDMKLNSAYVEINTEDNYLYSKMVEDSLKKIKPKLKQGKEEFTVKSIKYYLFF
ncbi:MAG: hypothetical protein GXO49_06800, partial [Chlorobi bacterium]|nr:hypothetical protein [Chlorobiota bacterium]